MRRGRTRYCCCQRATNVLLHHWTLDEESGIRRDSVGAHDMLYQYNNPGAGVGILGNAMTCNNSGVYAAPLSLPQDFTITGWIFPTTNDGNVRGVFHNRQAFSLYAKTYNIHMRHTGTGGNKEVSFPLPFNEWTKFIYQISVSVGEMRLTTANSNPNSASTTISATVHADDFWGIGCAGLNFFQSWVGLLDDIRIYTGIFNG